MDLQDLQQQLAARIADGQPLTVDSTMLPLHQEPLGNLLALAHYNRQNPGNRKRPAMPDEAWVTNPILANPTLENTPKGFCLKGSLQLQAQDNTQAQDPVRAMPMQIDYRPLNTTAKEDTARGFDYTVTVEAGTWWGPSMLANDSGYNADNAIMAWEAETRERLLKMLDLQETTLVMDSQDNSPGNSLSREAPAGQEGAAKPSTAAADIPNVDADYTDTDEDEAASPRGITLSGKGLLKTEEGKGTALGGNFPLPIPGGNPRAIMSGKVLLKEGAPSHLLVGAQLPDKITLEALGNLVLEDMFLQLGTPLCLKGLHHEASLHYSCRLLLPQGEKKAPMPLRLTADTTLSARPAFALRGFFEGPGLTLPGLLAMTGLDANTLTQGWPEPLVKLLKNLALYELEFLLNQAPASEGNKNPSKRLGNAIGQVYAEVGMNDAWELVPGKLSLTEISLMITVTDPLNLQGNRQLDVTLSGTLDIAGAKTTISYDLASGTLEGLLQNLKMKEFVQRLSDGTVSLPDTMPELTLEQVSLAVNPFEKWVRFASTGSVEVPQLPLGGLSLDASLSCAVMADFSQPKRPTLSGFLGGQVLVGTMGLDAKITLNTATPFVGLDAQQMPDTALRLSEVLELLGAEGVNLPTALQEYDLTVRNLSINADSNKNLSLKGEVALEKESNLTLGEQALPLARLQISLTKAPESLQLQLTAEGHNVPPIPGLEATITAYRFTFGLNKAAGQPSHWKLGGHLEVHAFERDFTLTAEAAALDGEQTLRFVASGEGMPANEPLISIPDLLNGNKPLCTIAPRSFSLEMVRKNGQFTRLAMAVGADLAVYNTWANQQTLFSIKEGMLTGGFDKESQRSYLTFTSASTVIKPLNIMGLLPGFETMLRNAFAETDASHPKTTALLNMLEIRPQHFSFVKDAKGWQIGGSVRLVMTDGLKTVDEQLYKLTEKLFPKTGNQRYLEGGLYYSSQQGLIMELRNNNGVEVPDFLGQLAAQLSPEFKESFREATGQDPAETFALGNAYVLLDRMRLIINQHTTLDARLAIGLPSHLNDRLFGQESSLHGLIKTYQPAKLAKASPANPMGLPPASPVVEVLPDDNLMRISVSIGSQGISGQLDQFNIFDLGKLTGPFSGLITEEANGVVVDLNALAKGKAKNKAKETTQEYGKFRLEKFRFALDLSNASLAMSGGIELLSNNLRLPLRPLLQKLTALLPAHLPLRENLGKLAAIVPEGITLEGIDFYDPTTDRLSLEGMLDFLRQFLPQDMQEAELLPKELTTALNNASEHVSTLLPTKLLEYMSIKLPKGLNFRVEYTADQAVNFQLAVPPPTQAQQEAGIEDSLQLLMPAGGAMPPQGIMGLRLKKIGFGTALASNAFRLDLSAETSIFTLPDLAAGVGYGLARKLNPDNERVQRMVPNNRRLGRTFKAENLIVLIFPQAGIPIPVPLFYDELSVENAGPEGSQLAMGIGFPMPNLNLMGLVKDLGNLKGFFTNEKAMLPTRHYGKVYSPDTPIEKGLLPSFKLGPLYMELPGYLGYEKQAEGGTRPVRLGFDDLKVMDPRDLVALLGNMAKASILSAARKQQHTITTTNGQEEPPLNYLIKYLPASQRMGMRQFVFLELFETTFAWALATPDELADSVLPLMKELQQEAGAQDTDPWTPALASQLLPSPLPHGAEGLALLLRGGIKISDTFTLNALTATIISPQGVATGMGLRAKLAGLFDMSLTGSAAANKEGLQLGGSTQLTLLHGIPVLQGSFALQVGKQNSLAFTGMLDLFPKTLMGEASPIQLYTGPARGQRGEITGLLNADGITLGTLQEDGTLAPAGVHLELGNLYLAGSTRISSTRNQEAWELVLTCYNTTLNLQASSQPTPDGGQALQWTINASEPLNIGPLLTIASSSGQQGPSGRLQLHYAPQAKTPSLKEFYLSGKASLLGLNSSTKLAITANSIAMNLQGQLPLINYNLDLKGESLTNRSTMALSGKLDLLNKLVELSINNATYTSQEGSELFKGSGTLRFWGQDSANLTVEAGTEKGLPHFGIKATLDLFYIPGVFRLYTGTSSSMEPIAGAWTPDGLALKGGLQAHLGALELGGTIDLQATQDNNLSLSGSMGFNKGRLSGGGINYQLTKKGNVLTLAGKASETLALIPGLIEYGPGKGEVFMEIDTTAKVLKTFRAKGTLRFMGLTAATAINISQSRKLDFALVADYGTMQTRLNLTAKSLAKTASMALKGSVTAFGNQFQLNVDASYTASETAEQFTGRGTLNFWDRSAQVTLSLGMHNQKPSYAMRGQLVLINAKALKLYTGTRKEKTSWEGAWTPEALDLKGDLYLQIGALCLTGSGSLNLADTGQGRDLNMAANLAFSDGLLSGGNMALSITKSGNLLHLNGTAATAITLLPGILDFDGGGVLDIKIDHETRTLQALTLQASTTLLGLKSSTTLAIDEHRNYSLDLTHSSGIASANLNVSGKGLGRVEDMDLEGNLSLGGVVDLSLDATYQASKELPFQGTGVLSFWGKERMTLSVEAGALEGSPYATFEGQLDLFYAGGLRAYAGSPTSLGNLKGSLKKKALQVSGDFQIHFMDLLASGTLNLATDASGNIAASASLEFQSGILTGGRLNLAMAYDNGSKHMTLEGKSATAIKLGGGLLSLASNNHMRIVLDEKNKKVQEYMLKGNTSIWEIDATYLLHITEESFTLDSTVELPDMDVRLKATTGDTDNADDLLLSGSVDLAKLNAKIDVLYGAAGIRGSLEDQQRSAIKNGKKLSDTQWELKERKRKADYIRDMDSRWGKRSWDPDGFQYCVPPVSHVNYWSEGHWWVNGGKPVFSKGELEDVKRYYNYKIDLGMNAEPPKRHDVGRWFNGVARQLNDTVHSIGRDMSNTFRDVVNEVNRTVSEDILKNLNIDTTDLDNLNKTFNSGINALQHVADGLHEITTKLLTEKPFEVQAISYKDQPASALTSGKVEATISLKVLGKQQDPQSITLDVKDPVKSVVSVAKALMPAAMQSVIS